MNKNKSRGSKPNLHSQDRDKYREQLAQGQGLRGILDNPQFQAQVKECRQTWETALNNLDPLSDRFSLLAVGFRFRILALDDFINGLESTAKIADTAELMLNGEIDEQKGVIV